MTMKSNKLLYGVGKFTKGKYLGTIDKKQTESYKKWYHMLMRCYSESYIKRFPTYKNCLVCKEWHDFQVFARWFNENYYNTSGERLTLDKDILFEGNKVYSPKTCVLVPELLNIFFMQHFREYISGENKGVTAHGKRFRARCNFNKDRIHLGVFDNIAEASLAYEECKTKEIIRLIENYRSRVPEKVIARLKEILKSQERKLNIKKGELNE